MHTTPRSNSRVILKRHGEFIYIPPPLPMLRGGWFSVLSSKCLTVHPCLLPPFLVRPFSPCKTLENMTAVRIAAAGVPSVIGTYAQRDPKIVPRG